MSRDVSVAGAFILTPTCPPVGTTLKLEISLPPLYGPTPTVQLKGKARVLRIERAAESAAQSGFAVVSQGFTMEELKGNKGDQNYEVPADADLNKYKSVSIWCARFGVNFGAATLGSQKS